MEKRLWTLLCIIFCCSISFATSLIPSPSLVEKSKGVFKVRKKNMVVYVKDTTYVSARFLLKEIIGIGDISITYTKNPRKADLFFIIKKEGHQEAYELKIDP